MSLHKENAKPCSRSLSFKVEDTNTFTFCHFPTKAIFVNVLRTVLLCGICFILSLYCLQYVIFITYSLFQIAQATIFSIIYNFILPIILCDFTVRVSTSKSQVLEFVFFLKYPNKVNHLRCLKLLHIVIKDVYLQRVTRRVPCSLCSREFSLRISSKVQSI